MIYRAAEFPKGSINGRWLNGKRQREAEKYAFFSIYHYSNNKPSNQNFLKFFGRVLYIDKYLLCRKLCSHEQSN